MQDVESPGPIDVVVIEFPDGAATERAADELEAVLELGVVRLFDLVAVRSEADGGAVEIDLPRPARPSGAFARFAGARSGLFDATDVQEAAAILEPGTIAVLVAYENTWARPFVTAAHAAGGHIDGQGAHPGPGARRRTRRRRVHRLTNERTPRCQDSYAGSPGPP